MTNEREELAKASERESDELHALVARLWGNYSSAKVADAILASGFRKPAEPVTVEWGTRIVGEPYVNAVAEERAREDVYAWNSRSWRDGSRGELVSREVGSWIPVPDAEGERG